MYVFMCHIYFYGKVMEMKIKIKMKLRKNSS